jgi:hypothetical protein
MQAVKQQSNLAWLMLEVGLILLPRELLATSITVKHQEGTYHGFVVLRSTEGTLLATGDAIQTVKGNRVYSELMLHFKDGSIHEEETVFSQGPVFRLITDHLREEGPAFPDPVDAHIDVAGGHISVRGKDGKDKETQLRLPEDLANGMLITILKNLTPDAETAVSLVTTDSKPRVVKFTFRPRGEESFSAGGPVRKASHFVGHTEIGGVAGVVASVTGKQPADVNFWVAGGKAPAFLRFLGPLYNGGPAWSIELAAPKLENETSAKER